MRREGDAQCSVKLKRGGLDVEAEEGTEEVQNRKSKRGGLDVEAEEWHGEVQKGSQSVVDWTLKRRNGTEKSKKEVKA